MVDCVGWGGFVLFLVWRWKFVGVFSGKGCGWRPIKGAILLERAKTAAFRI